MDRLIRKTCQDIITYIDFLGRTSNGIFVYEDGRTHDLIAKKIARRMGFPIDKTRRIFNTMCLHYWGPTWSYMNQPYSGSLKEYPKNVNFFCDPEDVVRI